MGSLISKFKNKKRQNQQTQDEPDTDTAIKRLENQEENVSKSSIDIVIMCSTSILYIVCDIR